MVACVPFSSISRQRNALAIALTHRLSDLLWCERQAADFRLIQKRVRIVGSNRISDNID
jgi:hypothetical protein